MNKEIKTKEYLEKLQQAKLSDSSRTRMQSNLLEYARFHSVRMENDIRSIKQVPRSTSLFRLKYTYMPIAILIALMIGGGTSYAAQGTVPGDLLYPVKIEFNESVRSAFTFGAEAEAELQAALIAERVEEAHELEEEGRLDAEVTAVLAASLKSHSDKAALALDESTDEGDAALIARISSSLGQFNALVETDSALAIAGPFVSLDSDVNLGTLLSTGSISLEAQRAQTEIRVQKLVQIVEKNEAKIAANVYISLTEKLEIANDLIIKSKTQAELESQQSIQQAAELAGEVEAELSTLGTVMVDLNTGAIIDIDFSKVPPKELPAGDNDTSGSIEVDTDLDAVIDLDGVEINGAARSGLRL